jgi:hypothetical protein
VERLQAAPIWEINPHRTRRYDVDLFSAEAPGNQ